MPNRHAHTHAQNTHTHGHTALIQWLTAGPAWITMTTERRSLALVSRAMSCEFTQVRQPSSGEKRGLSPSSSPLLLSPFKPPPPLSLPSSHFPIPPPSFCMNFPLLFSSLLLASPPSPVALTSPDKALSGCQRPPRADWLPAKNKSWEKNLRELPPSERKQEKGWNWIEVCRIWGGD